MEECCQVWESSREELQGLSLGNSGSSLLAILNCHTPKPPYNFQTLLIFCWHFRILHMKEGRKCTKILSGINGNFCPYVTTIIWNEINLSTFSTFECLRLPKPDNRKQNNLALILCPVLPVAQFHWFSWIRIELSETSYVLSRLCSVDDW